MIFLSMIIMITLKILNTKSKYQENRNQILSMPEFDFISVNNTDSIKKQMHNTHVIIINYFNTNCDFCRHEIRDIISYQDLFKNMCILLISDQSIDTLKKFNETIKMDSFPSINICKVDYLSFTDKFGNVLPPTTFMYDSNKRLIKKYKGQIRAPVMANDIKEYYNPINNQ